MKPELFVSAFLLVMGGVCLVWARHNGQLQIAGMHPNNHHIVVNSDEYHEELEYAGRIGISEDETTLQSISPDGYLRYIRNDSSIEIINDTVHHRLSCTFQVNGNKIENDSARIGMTQQALAAMFRWGYMAVERMEKLYRRGGDSALLQALSNLSDNNLKARYAIRILKADTSAAQLLPLTQYLQNGFPDGPEKEEVLGRYTAQQLADTTLSTAYLGAIATVRDESSRAILLQQYLKKKPSGAALDHVIAISTHIGDENLRADIARDMMLLPPADSNHWPRILRIVGSMREESQKTDMLLRVIADTTHGRAGFADIMAATTTIGASEWKADIYRSLADRFPMQDTEWQALIEQIAAIPDDNEKSELLFSIARKKSGVPAINASLKTAARSIHDDALLGRVVREIN
jgi:hypothetical protein